jgi:hypothetical protein
VSVAFVCSCYITDIRCISVIIIWESKKNDDNWSGKENNEESQLSNNINYSINPLNCQLKSYKWGNFVKKTPNISLPSNGGKTSSNSLLNKRDTTMHQWVFGSWRFEAMERPHFQWSKCPRRNAGNRLTNVAASYTRIKQSSYAPPHEHQNLQQGHRYLLHLDRLYRLHTDTSY